jgi:non-ribosomal peptide synthetase component F
MHSLIYVNTFNKKDIAVQMARCSFDIHVQEVLGTLMSGATLVMLHPGGTIDFDYLTRVLGEKQITYMHTVPSLLYNLFTFFQNFDNREPMKYLRSLCSSGG